MSDLVASIKQLVQESTLFDVYGNRVLDTDANLLNHVLLKTLVFNAEQSLMNKDVQSFVLVVTPKVSAWFAAASDAAPTAIEFAEVSAQP